MNGGLDQSYTEPSFEKIKVIQKSLFDLIIVSENYHIIKVKLSSNLRISAQYLRSDQHLRSKSGSIFRESLPNMICYKKKGRIHTWKIKARKTVKDVVVYNQQLDILLVAKRNSLRVCFSNGRQKQYILGTTKYTKMIQLENRPFLLILWDDFNQELVYFNDLSYSLDLSFKKIIFKLKGNDFINDIKPMSEFYVAALSVDGLIRIIGIHEGVIFEQKLNMLPQEVNSILRSQISFKQFELGKNLDSNFIFILGQSSDDRYSIGLYRVIWIDQQKDKVQSIKRLQIINLNVYLNEKYSLRTLNTVRLEYNSQFSCLLVKFERIIIGFSVDKQQNQFVEKFNYKFKTPELDYSILQHPSYQRHFLALSARKDINSHKLFEIIDLGKNISNSQK